MAPACRAPYCPPQSPSTGVLACRAVAAACNPTTAITITVIPMPIALGAWRRLAVLACLLAAMPAAGAQAKVQPDILLIVADDLGYSDIGAFGAEIATPNLDRLAEGGVRLANFHAAPTCSPTRAMLLSGTDNHTAGVGAMAEAPRPELAGRYGYEGRISERVATLAERLGAAGYTSIMAGKWHLGMTPESLPSARGFDRSFALLQGGHNHVGHGGFGATLKGHMGVDYLDDGRPVTVADDFFSSDAFTDRLMEKIDQVAADRPIFAFLSFTAPHSPLQAPSAFIDKYRGNYDGGWARLRDDRIARMKTLGLMDVRAFAGPLAPDAASWEQLNSEQRRRAARAMEVYAAMVDNMDWNIGRLLDHLEASGRGRDTLVLFLSDNGPAGQVAEDYMVVPSVRERLEGADNSLDNLGAGESYVFYGPHWAAAGSAPFRLTKGAVTEGGTRVPAIIAGAGIERRGAIGHAYGTVMDVVPTVLELAGVPLTDEVDGRAVAPVTGRSMVAHLRGQAARVHPEDAAIVYELHGQRSVVRGDWKLLWMPAPLGTGAWQLFNLAEDPGEHRDLAAELPDIRDRLIADWQAYVARAQVLVN